VRASSSAMPSDHVYLIFAVAERSRAVDAFAAANRHNFSPTNSKLDVAEKNKALLWAILLLSFKTFVLVLRTSVFEIFCVL